MIVLCGVCGVVHCIVLVGLLWHVCGGVLLLLLWFCCCVCRVRVVCVGWLCVYIVVCRMFACV